MTVEAVPPVSPDPATQRTGTTPTLDYDDFLRLLVAQMENQDPLEPMSDTEYVAQLATFSNVEQNIITNERLASMMTANALGDAGSLIGRTLEFGDSTGRVESVRITGEGTLAVLADGTEVVVGEGVTIR